MPLKLKDLILHNLIKQAEHIMVFNEWEGPDDDVFNPDMISIVFVKNINFIPPDDWDGLLDEYLSIRGYPHNNEYFYVLGPFGDPSLEVKSMQKKDFDKILDLVTYTYFQTHVTNPGFIIINPLPDPNMFI